MVADHGLAGIQALPVGGTICGIDDQCVEGADIATAQLVLLKTDLLSEAFGEFEHDSTVVGLGLSLVVSARNHHLHFATPCERPCIGMTS